KFLEHFFYIAHAVNSRKSMRGDSEDLWDEQDEFYYDLVRLPDGSSAFVRVRSMVGLIPLLAVETLDAELLGQLPDFRKRLGRVFHYQSEVLGGRGALTRTGE